MVKIFISNLEQWDKTLCLKFFSPNPRQIMRYFMHVFSKLGDGPLYGWLCLLIIIVDRTTGIKLIISALPAFALEIIIQKGVKHLIKRPRPCHVLPEIVNRIQPPDDFSFPSGHTAGGFLMAVLISYFFPVLAIPCFILASLIGISRIYNGVHYPGDVLAGMVLGILCAQLSIKILFSAGLL